MRRALIPIVVLLLAAAACSGVGGERVASVNDVEITLDDVTRYLEGDRLAIDSGFREVLFRMIAAEAFDQTYADQFGELDEAEVDAVYQDLLDSIAAEGLTVAEASEIPQGKDAVMELNARISVVRDSVVAETVTTESFVQSLLDDPLTTATVCVRHILTQTMEEIVAAGQRIEGGEDFGEVAAEASIDTTSPGGDLGCQPAGVYPAEFAQAAMAADLGALWGPFQSEFGFHLIIVDDRSTPTPEEVRSDPVAFVNDEIIGSIWTAWFNASLQGADISIEPRFGSWSATSLRVEPSPEG